MIPVTKLNRQYGLFIDGAWRPSADGKTFDSFCPATGDKLASCAEATSQDVDAAVDAAWKAFATWKKTTVKEEAAEKVSIHFINRYRCHTLASVPIFLYNRSREPTINQK